MEIESEDNKKTKLQLLIEISRLRLKLKVLEKKNLELSLNQRQTKKMISKTSEQAQKYLDIAEVMIVVINAHGNISLINRKGNRILEYEDGTLLGKNWFETCLPPSNRDRVFLVFKELICGKVKNVEYFENSVITKNGKERFIAWHNSLLRDEKGNIIGTLSSGEDITERRMMEHALKESEEKYRMLAEYSTDVIWTTDLNFNPTYISPSVEKLRGYSVQEVMNEKLENSLTPESLNQLKEYRSKSSYHKNIKSTNFPTRSPIQLEYFCKDGSTVWVENVISCLKDSDDKIIGYMGVTRDISERKEADEKLKASLREKVLLLKEIHHRVKNNMAVISSLLNLQSEAFTEASVVGAFRDCQQRIYSMALVHEKLYQADDLSKIDFSEYINDLSYQVSKSNQFRLNDVRIKIKSLNIKMTIDLAIPCGLIINELLTNAFKYAFPKNQKGLIRISLKLKKNENYELIVSDNGIGIPDGIDLQKPTSFGLNLVYLLTNQLRGDIVFNRKNGSTIKITFPVNI